MVPFDAPVISDVSPGALIRRSPYNLRDPFVEQVRLTSLAQARLLPGIDAPRPSRLKDSVSQPFWNWDAMKWIAFWFESQVFSAGI